MTQTVGVVWLVCCVLTAGIELTGVFRNRAGATHRDRSSGLVLRLIMIPAIGVMVFSPSIAPGSDIEPKVASMIAGTIIFVVGETLRVWSRKTLGRYFTYSVQTSSDQPVIDTGPYRLVRHPSYTGILLIIIGFGGVWANWLGLAVGTALTFIGLAYRIHVEEQALATELGDAYAEYARTHKRLVPYLY